MSSSGLRGANRAVSGMGSDLYGNHSLGGGSNSSGMHYLANSSGVRDGAAPIQNGMRRASMGVGRGTAIGMYVNSLLNPSSQQFPSAKDIGENGINDDDNDCVLSAIKGRNIKVSANDVMNPMMRHRRRRSSLGHVSRHDLMPVVMQTISVARQEHNHRDYVSLAAANGKSDGGSEQNSDEGGHLTAQAAAGDLISVSPQHRQRLLFDAFAVTSPLGSPQLAHSARRLKGRRNSLAGALPSYFSKNISSGLRASSEGMDRGSSESLYAELRAAMLGNGGNEGIDRGESMNKDLSSSNVDGGRARTRKLESRSKTKGTSAGIDRNGDGSSDAADNQKGQAKGRIKRKKDQWKVHTLYTLPSLHSDEKKKDDDSVVAQSELIYPEFLEALTCLAVWKYPDPYFRISHRLEHFLVADVFPAFRGAVEQQKEAQKTK